MNCVLFVKMNQVFSLKKKNNKALNNTGKVWEFFQSGKVGTMNNRETFYISRIYQGSHSTWKNESTPGKPGNIMEFWKI